MAELRETLLAKNTWTLVSEETTEFQVVSQKQVLYTESETLPTGSTLQETTVSYKWAAPHVLYRFNNKYNTNLYMFSPEVPAVISDGENIERVNTSPPTVKVPADNFFIQENGPATTLVVPAVFDGKQIQVTDPSNFSIGDFVVITNPASIYFGEVLAVVGDIITLDSLLPFAYPVSITAVQSYTKDMNVDGSIVPQVFSVFGPGAPNVQLNIVRFVWDILTAAAVDLSKFGDIAGGVTNGLLIRGVPNPSSGVPASNQFNIKTNSDFNTISGGDWKPYSAQNIQQGQHGCNTRYTMGGEEKHDAIPPLNVGDRIDSILTDDFSTLLRFRTLFGGNTEFLL